jgi:hypothetical protein
VIAMTERNFRPPLAALHFCVTFALLAAVVGMIWSEATPPPWRDRDAPVDRFSAGRARVDIESLVALGPRPSKPHNEPAVPSHAQAKDLLIKRFFELGMSPQLQVGQLQTRNGSIYQVENIIGRLDPPNQRQAATDAVVLLSHYDSVAAGPGAGDAAAGVATVLEIARALHKSATLRRPLIVVIDDGEEVNLLGARLLLSHPFAAEAAVVLNFEARGTSGQTAMFETSERSAWLVELYGRSAARPVASSVIYSLYRMLPNDTDLTLTKAAGIAGLNFAFADEDWNYHTSRDDLSHLDLRSVQHMGDQGLSIARALVERAEPLPSSRPPSDSQAVWFDLFSRRLIVYRAATATVLLGLLIVAYGAALLLSLRRGGGRAIGDGLLRFAATLFALIVAGQLVQKAVALLSPVARPWRTAPFFTFAALVLTGVAVGGGVQWLCDRLRPARAATDEDSLTNQVTDQVIGQALGGLAPSLILSLSLTFAVVGASYPFTLPALAVALPIALVLRRPTIARSTLWAALLPGLFTTALLWFPLLRVVRVMVGAQLPAAVMLPVALALPFYEPLARLFQPRLRAAVPIAAGLAAFVFIVIAARA